MFRLILRSLSFQSSCKYVNPHSNLQTLRPLSRKPEEEEAETNNEPKIARLDVT